MKQDNIYQAPSAELELPEGGQPRAQHATLMLVAITLQAILIGFLAPSVIGFTEVGEISVLTLLAILLSGLLLVTSALLIFTRRLFTARLVLIAVFILSALSAYPSREGIMYLCIGVSGFCALVCTRTYRPASTSRIEPT